MYKLKRLVKATTDGKSCQQVLDRLVQSMINAGQINTHSGGRKMINRLTGSILGLALLLPIAPAAFAQDAVLEEITVTAQRREENLQEVPVAVTAFTGADLVRQNITNATQYLARTPNVSFTEDGQSGTRGMGVAIRGINNLVSGENAFINSIGIYFDEFSVTSVPNQVANPLLPDMGVVEVLRGPQGTYFGRNSVGGALNLTSNSPTDEFEGSIRLGTEGYDDTGEELDQYNFTGVINIPMGDKFAMRGVLYYEDSNGLVENACATGASASRSGACG
jgi:iron complex outermembrane receptor protein